jgi:myo-inositol 2-dehydrogenase/D-chiro-inositol 1-dehydrogenase/scyllo-inositol 2-dehydrogenase (NAD+)
MMRNITLALIGAGRIARVHARSLSKLSHCRTKWVVDPVKQAAQELSKTLEASATQDLDQALSDSEVNAVLVASPTPTHVEVVIAAARKGKAIFLEKPLAHSLEAGAAVVEHVEEAQVPIQVGFMRRYDPDYQHAAELVRAGALGKIECFRAVARDSVPPSRSFLRTSGGLFVDLGIHDLDVARFLMGEVETVYAVGGALSAPDLANEGLYDTAVACLHFKSGAVGTLELGLHTVYGYEVRTEVLGEKGRVQIGTHQLGVTIFDEGGACMPHKATYEERYLQAYQNELRAFVDSLHAGRSLAPGVRDAWSSLRLALAAQHALESQCLVRVDDFGQRLLPRKGGKE